MSLPLSMCTFIAAAKGDEEANKIVIDRYRQPAFTFWPCECEPRCEHPTEEQMTKWLLEMADNAPDVLFKIAGLKQG